MTLQEQCAVLLESVENEFLRLGDIIQWADGQIVAAEKPPAWLIDLSTLHPDQMVEFVSCLRKQASESRTVVGFFHQTIRPLISLSPPASESRSS
jgi:hypothetical protein